MKSPAYFVTLPEPLAARVERARKREPRGAGLAAEVPMSATLRALVLLGLDTLDAQAHGEAGGA